MKRLHLLRSVCVSFALLIPALVFADANSTIATEQKSVKPIDWQPCFSAQNSRLLCAQYAVPLNYQEFNYPGKDSKKSRSETINISLVKLPASNTNQKPLGSLFLNPGGPGGSGVELVRYSGKYLFTQAVRDQYDLIGFDPRGISTSEPLTCGVSQEQAAQILPPFSFPLTSEEERQKIDSDKLLNAFCQKNANAIIDHMSTADVARDLDLLRQAVGDKLLNYVGYSYGSYIGVTYANLFPQNVGHLVVDGVLDPLEWSTGRGWSGWIKPVTARLGSDKGAMATLKEFFRLCDLVGTSGCSFSGNSAARFDAIAQRLKTQPQPIDLPNGIHLDLTYSIMIGSVLQALYSSPSWGYFADLLTFLESSAPPQQLGATFSNFRNDLGVENITPPSDNEIFGFPGVLCSDSDNPSDVDFWSLWATESASTGYFGRQWIWDSSQCVNWPGSQQSRFTGPFNHKTKNPVLVANTLFDPATPYAGAETVSRLLPNSRLITVEGWGHTTPGLSTCADNITANYLLYGDLPVVGTRCQQNVMPFVVPDGVDVFADMPQVGTTAGHQHHSDIKRNREEYDDSDSKHARQAIMHNHHSLH